MNYTKLTSNSKYTEFLDYLYRKFHSRVFSIQACVETFKKEYSWLNAPSKSTVYNRVSKELIETLISDITYKRHKKKNKTYNIVTIVDCASRKLWIIKGLYKFEYYMNKFIFN